MRKTGWCVKPSGSFSMPFELFDPRSNSNCGEIHESLFADAMTHSNLCGREPYPPKQSADLAQFQTSDQMFSGFSILEFIQVLLDTRPRKSRPGQTPARSSRTASLLAQRG